MKKTTILAFVCLLAAFLSGCKHNEREYFDTDYTALNIWLGSVSYPTDKQIYNFVTHSDMDSVAFHARITGLAADYDRTFSLEPVAGHIDKVEFYTPDEFVIPAGEYEASFWIYFGKPENYSEFRYSEGFLVFKIKSEYFDDGAASDNQVGTNRLYFVLQNSVTKPYNWDSDSYPFHPDGLARYFGSYSDAKYEFMISTLGISDIRPLFSGDPDDYEETNVYSLMQVNYFVSKCRSALAVYNADPDNILTGRAPLMDEFGFPVTF